MDFQSLDHGPLFPLDSSGQAQPFSPSLDERSLKIHRRACQLAASYRRTEAELIEVLQEVEKHRIHLKMDRTSVFAYAVQDLGLARDRAYDLITIARKAREVPELKTEIERGAITLSSARRLSSVITPENRTEWLHKGAHLTTLQLQKEIVRVKPQEATRERAVYATPNRIRLELGLTESDMLRLRRAQDLVSQSQRCAATLEGTLQVLVSEYLRRHDPVEKAKRHRVRIAAPHSPSEQVPSGRQPIDPVSSIPGQVRTEKRPKADTQNPEKREPQEITENPTPSLRKLGTNRVRAAEASAKHFDRSRDSARVSSPDRDLSPIRTAGRRTPVPAAILHAVNLRDQRRCAHLFKDGSRCHHRRWIDVHHRIPVSQGGRHELENLITLCSVHHRLWHEELRKRGKS